MGSLISRTSSCRLQRRSRGILEWGVPKRKVRGLLYWVDRRGRYRVCRIPGEGIRYRHRQHLLKRSYLVEITWVLRTGDVYAGVWARTSCSGTILIGRLLRSDHLGPATWECVLEPAGWYWQIGRLRESGLLIKSTAVDTVIDAERGGGKVPKLGGCGNS